MGRKTNEIKLQYALKNGNITYISDIPEEERGLKCNCVCPCCNTPLQARLGNTRQHHFAHSNSNCNPAVAQQTILHMLAKEIIEKEKTIAFPPYFISCEDIGLENKNYLKPYCCNKEKTIDFDSVTLEKRISDIVPDIIVQKNGKECLIEIAVTHFVNEDKEKKIFKLNIPMIEIDLSNYGSKDKIDRQILTSLLKNNIEIKKWITNPRIFEMHKEKAIKHFQEQINDHQKKEEEYALKIQEQQIKAWAFAKYAPYINPDATKKKIQNALRSDNYKIIIQSFRNDKSAFTAYEKMKMHKESREIPFYFDIPIRGEIVFNCDRRIWQMTLFEKFIYNRSKKGVIINNKSIQNFFVKFCEDEKGYKLINWNYYSTDFAYNLLWVTIDKYLQILHKLGWITYSETKQLAIVNHVHTIAPPNNHYTELLKQALHEVDSFSMDATEKIDEYIAQKSNHQFNFPL